MNRWRWAGAFIFALSAACLLSTDKLPVYGQEKKEDKKADTKAQEKKADEKKAEEKKTEEKKTEEKKVEQKEEKKTETTAGKGDGWKFTAFDPKGKPFYQELTTTTDQRMKVMGQTVEQKQKQTFIIQWTPKEKDAKGNYVVTQKIVGVKMNIDIGGNKINYDSTLPKEKQPKNPMTDFFNQLLNQDLTFSISPDKMEVTDIQGRNEFIKSLGDTNPQMTSLLKTILSEDALKKMAEPTWWALPTDSPEKTKTWNRESTLNLGPIGSYKTKFDFTYGGKKGDLEKIDIKSQMTYTAPQDKAGLPFVIKTADLKSKEGSGEALFDPAKGRFDSTKMTMKLDGTLTIEVGNMSTDISLEQTQDSTSKSSDANPWGDTKK
jgi:hypothetical protein